MKITSIIVTYNRPDVLEAIFLSLIGQREKPDEVIIADDGSRPETAALISRYMENSPFELKHVWHEDKGFRAATIRNSAIIESTGDFLIFSDGDLLFHPLFFHDFKKRITPGTAFIGSRVFLTPESSQRIIDRELQKLKIPFWSRAVETNRLNAMRIPLAGRLFAPVPYSSLLRGGLSGIWKSDIQAVNGWNESFSGWGFEDTELISRLYNNGIILQKIKFAAITYHMWHPVANRELLTENRRLLRNTVDNRLTWCSNGLIKTERI